MKTKIVISFTPQEHEKNIDELFKTNDIKGKPIIFHKVVRNGTKISYLTYIHYEDNEVKNV